MTHELKLFCLTLLIDRLASDRAYTSSEFIEESREILNGELSLQVTEFLTQHGLINGDTK